MIYLIYSRALLYFSKTSFHNKIIVNSQQLLYINILIGVLIVLYFVFGRKKARQVARLRMRDLPKDVSEKLADSTESKNESGSNENNIIQFSLPTPEATKPFEAPDATDVTEPSPAVVIPMPVAAPKTLKVYFAFNSHDWEAYEALGVPVNAPITTVTKMYQHLIKTSDSSTFDFYESAYSAIIQRRKEQK